MVASSGTREERGLGGEMLPPRSYISDRAIHQIIRLERMIRRRRLKVWEAGLYLWIFLSKRKAVNISKRPPNVLL